ncbi:hypothetical protein Tco_0600113 [Tanacetum coccineum]|uniref:Uncharacterized protein n=1 Tax=Tanacetum coccineum TaxID=301880 RepID=A0ABQ4WAY4_9ASTR
MNEKGIDSSKNEMVKEEDKEEESTRKRKLSTRKKMKSRKRRFIQNTSEDDSEKENDELRLHLTIAPDEEKEVDYEILDRKYPIKEWKIEYLGTKPQDDEDKVFGTHTAGLEYSRGGELKLHVSSGVHDFND